MLWHPFDIKMFSSCKKKKKRKKVISSLWNKKTCSFFWEHQSFDIIWYDIVAAAAEYKKLARCIHDTRKSTSFFAIISLRELKVRFFKILLILDSKISLVFIVCTCQLSKVKVIFNSFSIPWTDPAFQNEFVEFLV